MLETWEKALETLAQAAMFISAVLMVALIAIFGWLVYGRYVVNATPTWVEQAALLMVVWITFLGAAVGVHRRTHLSVDFIRDAMPDRLRSFSLFVSLVALLFFGAVMAWQGYVMYERTAQRMIPLLGISEGWRAVPVSLSGALITLFTLSDIIKTFITKKTPL